MWGEGKCEAHEREGRAGAEAEDEGECKNERVEVLATADLLLRFKLKPSSSDLVP